MTLIEDTALIVSREVMAIFMPIMEQEEYESVLPVVYHTVKDGLEAFEIQRLKAFRGVPSSS